MKKIFLLAMASVMTFGAIASNNIKAKHVKRANKTCTQPCPPTCPKGSGCCNH